MPCDSPANPNGSCKKRGTLPVTHICNNRHNHGYLSFPLVTFFFSFVGGPLLRFTSHFRGNRNVSFIKTHTTKITTRVWKNIGGRGNKKLQKTVWCENGKSNPWLPFCSILKRRLLSKRITFIWQKRLKINAMGNKKREQIRHCRQLIVERAKIFCSLAGWVWRWWWSGRYTCCSLSNLHVSSYTCGLLSWPTWIRPST